MLDAIKNLMRDKSRVHFLQVTDLETDLVMNCATKNGHAFITISDQQTELKSLCVAWGDYAANRDLDFTWFDCALTNKIVRGADE